MTAQTPRYVVPLVGIHLDPLLHPKPERIRRNLKKLWKLKCSQKGLGTKSVRLSPFACLILVVLYLLVTSSLPTYRPPGIK